MTNEKKKIIVINQNEIKADIELNTNQTVLCGTCMYYNEDKKCIVGIPCAKVCVFNGREKIRKIKTDLNGNYYTRVSGNNIYSICTCKNNNKQKVDIMCKDSLLYIKHFVFEKNSHFK